MVTALEYLSASFAVGTACKPCATCCPVLRRAAARFARNFRLSRIMECLAPCCCCLRHTSAASLIRRSMSKLAVLNAAGVAATVLLALAAAALAAVAAASGQAHAVPMLPQWDVLGPTRGDQWEALAEVVPVILACYVAHQSLHSLMPLLRPYSPSRMLQVSEARPALCC